MKKPVIVALVLGAVFLAAIILTTWGGSKYRVKICIAFQGRTQCEIALARTRQEALRAATDTACAQIAGGQSELERCRNTPPAVEEWLNVQ